MHRSGTNFLHNLICLHPECTEPEDLAEDFLVSKLSAIESYVKGVQRQWNPRWNPHGKENMLRKELADGLLRFANNERRDKTKRLVFKTPTVESLELFRTGTSLLLDTCNRPIAGSQSSWQIQTVSGTLRIHGE